MNDSIPSLHVIYIPYNSILATNRASLLFFESKRGFGHRSHVQQEHQAPGTRLHSNMLTPLERQHSCTNNSDFIFDSPAYGYPIPEKSSCYSTSFPFLDESISLILLPFVGFRTGRRTPRIDPGRSIDWECDRWLRNESRSIALQPEPTENVREASAVVWADTNLKAQTPRQIHSLAMRNGIQIFQQKEFCIPKGISKNLIQESNQSKNPATRE